MYLHRRQLSETKPLLCIVIGRMRESFFRKTWMCSSFKKWSEIKSPKLLFENSACSTIKKVRKWIFGNFFSCTLGFQEEQLIDDLFCSHCTQRAVLMTVHYCFCLFFFCDRFLFGTTAKHIYHNITVEHRGHSPTVVSASILSDKWCDKDLISTTPCLSVLMRCV